MNVSHYFVSNKITLTHFMSTRKHATKNKKNVHKIVFLFQTPAVEFLT